MRTVTYFAILFGYAIASSACSSGADNDTAMPSSHTPKLDSGTSALVDSGAKAAKDSAVPEVFAQDAAAPKKEGGSELCNNGLDDNNDGVIDEGCACKAGDVQSCFLGEASLAGVGKCKRGQQTCVKGSGTGEFQGTSWGTCTGAGEPAEEVCNGIDDDCDGKIDSTEEGPLSKPCSTACGTGKQLCVGGDWQACSAAGPMDAGANVGSCSGKECGDDGCGNSCGPASAACSVTYGSCNVSGTKTCAGNSYGGCSAGPDPRPGNCAGKNCGDSDGCGGTCEGPCPNAGSCNSQHHCDPPSCGALLSVKGLPDVQLGCCANGCLETQAGGPGETNDCNYCCSNHPGGNWCQ